MNTILFLNKVGQAVGIEVIDTVLPVDACKSFAGREFNADEMVISASVINSEGLEVLDLRKDENGHCIKRISL